MNYFLIGMPGSGKSTLGKEVASLFNLKYLDLDNFIEKREGETIPEIFRKYGQQYFRDKETSALKDIIENHDNVLVSTGGGAPCFNNNINLINAGGLSIYIDVSVEELSKRVRLGKQNRPLFEGLNSDEVYIKLEQMMVEREPFYLQAKIHIKGDRLSPLNILERLKEKSKGEH